MRSLTVSHPVGEIARFGIVGIGATLTHFCLLTLAVELLGLGPTVATGIAFCLALFVSYFGQSLWVFRKDPNFRRQFPKFTASALFGLLANTGLMFALTQKAGLDYQLSFLLSVFIVPAMTYVINKLWVFNET